MELTSRKELVQCLQHVRDLAMDWEDKRKKISAQLESIRNLQLQLNALKKCQQENKLGVLSSVPNVQIRLEGKIVLAEQRALSFILRDKSLMNGIVSQLIEEKKIARQILTRFVGAKGCEVASHRTASNFSLSDYMKWIDEMTCLLYTEWTELIKTIDSPPIAVSPELVNQWKKEIFRLKSL
jgi:hypothetical protein